MEKLDHYYKILGIKPSSSLLEINQAYIRAINLLLPHRSSTDPDVQKKAQAQAQEINEAYEKIKKSTAPATRQTPLSGLTALRFPLYDANPSPLPRSTPRWTKRRQ